jgi:hypothetical protein
MGKVLADGIEFDVQDYLEDAMSAQPALIEARNKQGHALCLCTTPPRKLVIREVNEVFFLAVWPHDGHHHDPGCEFYRPGDEPQEPGLDGLPTPSPACKDHTQGTPERAAVSLNADGTWTVALDISTHTGFRDEAVTSQKLSAIAATGTSKETRTLLHSALSLPQFLDWLWNNTSLNRWGKSWRRDWWRVIQSIRTEAQVVVIDGRAMNELLYIPPPFVRERQAAIQDGWNRFVAPLMTTAHSRAGPQRGLVLMEVKAIDRTQYGFKVLGRNLARPIFVDEHLHASIARHNTLALAMLPRSRELSCSVVGLFAIEATDRGNLRAVAAALMVTNSRYIPVSTLYELKLSNALCAADRTFTRGVGKHQGADFVLRDTNPSTALLIYSLHTPDYVRKRETIADACAQAGCTIWKWYPENDQEIPALPAVA